MTEDIYGEIVALRTAIRHAVNELDSAECGEGLSYNIYHIKRDLEKVLKDTLVARVAMGSGKQP